MEFEAPKNLAEQIAKHISDKIITWEIKPGERILETQIAEELGVSRSPIREALRILEKSQLVELVPRRGARATEISGSYIGWLYDILMELLGLVARKCTENSTQEDLKKINDAMFKTVACAEKGDSTGYYDEIIQFALACLAAARNPLLEQMIYDLLPSIRRILFATFSLRKDELLENAHLVQTGNQHVQNGNAAMASKTVQDWVVNEKEFALKFALNPDH